MSTIKIYNPKLKHEILIDTSISWVVFHPRAYDEKPYFEIKLLNGFDLSRHALTCEDCGAFIKSIGTDTLDWYLEYNDTTYRLSLENLGTDTKLKHINSYYEFGTVLQLRVHEIPVDRDGLIELRDKLVLEENFERACVIRDLINDVKNQL
jgi:protein-arginine kinase activator protein McsA